MRVLFDSNIYIADFQLAGNAFIVFFDRLPRLDARFILPAIVLEEVMNKYAERLHELNAKTLELQKDYRRLVELDFKQKIVDVEAEVIKQRLYMTRTLPNSFIDRRGYPAVEHEALVRRALQRRKPFDENGRAGYRDVLLWENILEFLREKPSDIVHFVTQNYRDFGRSKDSPEQLHQHLVADLSANSIAPDRLVLHASLDKFNERIIVPNLPHRPELIEPFQVGNIPKFNVGGWARRNLPDILMRSVENHVLAPEQIRRFAYVLSVVGTIHGVVVDDVLELESGNLWLSAAAKGSFRISINIDRAYLDVPEVQEFFGDMLIRGPNVAGLGRAVDVEAEVAFSVILQDDSMIPMSVQIDSILAHGKLHEFRPHPKYGAPRASS